MDLFLMQHGEATTEQENPDRPLTDSGRSAVERVAARAADLGVRLDRCVHSGKLRAEQTAALLVARLGGDVRVEAVEGLSPNDAVAPFAEWLSQQPDDQALAVVGHLPFLDRLASLLVADRETAQVVGFRMGGLVKLTPKPEATGYLVSWALTPDLA